MSNHIIGIKLADGSFYPVLEEGFLGKKRLVLSTVRDNQESMQIDFYRGKEKDIATSEYIGSLVIENIELKPKRIPEIEVIIGLDENNKLSAEARNLASDDKQSLSVVLESLDEERTYDMPEFEIGEDVETTKDFEEEEEPPQADEEESIAGETYPIEAEDRRKTHLKKKKSNPLMAILFVFLGLLLIAGLSVLIFWAVNRFFPTHPINTGSTGDIKKETTTSVRESDASETTVTGKETETGVAEEIEKDEEEPANTVSGGIYYKLKWGDTLWDLAATYYRDPFQYYRIYRHKPNKITDPDLIYAGRTIFIPEE
ncbi:MAG: Hsp70 family protein [Spirochaetales bacterium]|nr:Hsp70 family protein [Spirochaetales bacterium]